MNAYYDWKSPDTGNTKINLYLTDEDIEAYKRAESSKLSPEVCDLLDAIIEEAENANI